MKLRKVLASKSKNDSQLCMSHRVFVRVAGPCFGHCPAPAPARPWRQSCSELRCPSILAGEEHLCLSDGSALSGWGRHVVTGWGSHIVNGPSGSLATSTARGSPRGARKELASAVSVSLAVISRAVFRYYPEGEPVQDLTIAHRWKDQPSGDGGQCDERCGVRGEVHRPRHEDPRTPERSHPHRSKLTADITQPEVNEPRGIEGSRTSRPRVRPR